MCNRQPVGERGDRIVGFLETRRLALGEAFGVALNGFFELLTPIAGLAPHGLELIGLLGPEIAEPRCDGRIQADESCLNLLAVAGKCLAQILT